MGSKPRKYHIGRIKHLLNEVFNAWNFLSFHAAFNLAGKIPSIVNVLSIDLERYAYFKLSIMRLYQSSPHLKIDPHH